MNFGPQPVYPKIEFAVTEPEDVKAMAEAVERMVKVGLKISQREVRDRMGFSEPQVDEELLEPPNTTEPPIGAGPVAPKPPAPPTAKPSEPDPKKPARLAAHVAGCRCGGCLKAELLAPRADPVPTGLDDVEAALEEALADWQDITDPLLDPLREILATATSFEEALAMLEAKGPDGSKLAAALASATAVARGIGDVKD
jgi:phage gp29-like protein